MIQPHSDDPDVTAAAAEALAIVRRTLADLPSADAFDYGGHTLHVGEYNVCSRCTSSIAEAQQAYTALLGQADATTDPLVKEHLELAARLFSAEAAAAQIRAEFHNGQGSEPILNELLGFIHTRTIHDTYDHSHHQGD